MPRAGVVDVCLIPEIAFDLDRLCDFVKSILDRKDYCVICIAEGARARVCWEDFRPVLGRRRTAPTAPHAALAAHSPCSPVLSSPVSCRRGPGHHGQQRRQGHGRERQPHPAGAAAQGAAAAAAAVCCVVLCACLAGRLAALPASSLRTPPSSLSPTPQDIGVFLRDVFRKRFHGIDVKYIGGWGRTEGELQFCPRKAGTGWHTQAPRSPGRIPPPISLPPGADPSYMIRSIPTITTDRIYCKVGRGRG